MKVFVLCGYRHCSIYQQMLVLYGKRTVKSEVGEYIDGFLTSKNRFLNREEARELFVKNGGEPEFSRILYSEDLY